MAGMPEQTELTPLRARFLLRDGRELSCQVSDLSSRGALFHCAEPVAAGAPLVAYIEDVGRVEGIAGEATVNGFAVHFTLTGLKLARIEQNLRWLGLKQQGLASEERRNTRFNPDSGAVRLVLGGEELSCEVLDISLSGAAIRSPVRPELGSCVELGKTRGRVIRHMANGFAIEFLTPLEQVDLQRGLR